MRADVASAERRREVRVAARAWRRAGAIGDGTLQAIESLYPDDRARLGPVFRALALVFTVLALAGALGVIAISVPGPREFGAACLVLALLLAGATEVLLGPLRRADSGVEVATALWAFVSVLLAHGFLLERSLEGRTLATTLFAAALLLGALGSARWGSSLLAALAAVCGFLLLARLPAGRLLWILVAAAAAPFLLRGSESPALPPSHRRSCAIALAIAVVALYLAVHLGSWDYGWLEWLAGFRAARPSTPAWLRELSIVATALVPLAVLAFGAATRRTLLLGLGILLGVSALVTLSYYVHIAPTWLVLVASGAASLLATLAVTRWLRSGGGKERCGYTGEPLFEDVTRRHAMEIAAAMVTFGPEGRALPAERSLHPGGGRFGGGGATGDF